MAEALDFRDVDWVAEQLNIDKNAVYRYLNEGVLPGLQLGRKWLISESSLVAALKAEEQRQTHARRQLSFDDPEFYRRFERFSQRARRVLIVAQDEAVKRNHTYIGQEHILLAIATVPDSRGLMVLAALGVSAERLRAEVEAAIPAGSPSQVNGEIGLTPRARKAIDLAAEEALALNHAYVGVEHLVLGLLREGDGVGYGVHTGLGVTLESARAELKRQLETLPIAGYGYPIQGESGTQEDQTRTTEAEE